MTSENKVNSNDSALKYLFLKFFIRGYMTN